ncbi:hypothetical protein HQ545_00705 [Candidatus Woesearchaeota archaeon]|nr:hypothetical protein [Candidatus Woesearchaeota archaeon]
MTLVYHGTNIRAGISIARVGAILSPLEQKIEFLERIFREQPSRSFEKEYPGKTIDQFALEWVSTHYGECEIEHRVKCITVVNNIEPTKKYALNFEYGDGGLILGIDVDDSCIESLSEHYLNPDIKYVRGELYIDTLKKIFLSPTAKRRHESQIRQEFEFYNPQYFTIE